MEKKGIDPTINPVFTRKLSREILKVSLVASLLENSVANPAKAKRNNLTTSSSKRKTAMSNLDK